MSKVLVLYCCAKYLHMSDSFRSSRCLGQSSILILQAFTGRSSVASLVRVRAQCRHGGWSDCTIPASGRALCFSSSNGVEKEKRLGRLFKDRTWDDYPSASAQA